MYRKSAVAGMVAIFAVLEGVIEICWESPLRYSSSPPVILRTMLR